MPQVNTGFSDLLSIGGSLCLDLANTVDWRFSDRAVDRLSNYRDVVAWSEVFEVLPPAVLKMVARRARAKPDQARRALKRVKQCRESIYLIASAMACGKATEAQAFVQLNDIARPLLAATVFDGGGALVWAGDEDGLERLLWPVIWSFVDLWRGNGLARLCECANPSCRWLFLDHSRNASRRWCAMWNCGNRAKGRRFQAAHRGTGAGG